MVMSLHWLTKSKKNSRLINSLLQCLKVFTQSISILISYFVMELNKMIDPSSHKTSFDIRLPHDPQSKCNKFITKGYSTSLCLLNIIIKIGISIGLLIIVLYQLKPQYVINEMSRNMSRRNSSIQFSSKQRVFKEVIKLSETKKK